MDATYDGIKAFEINATYNNVSDVADTLREDVQAAISAFMQSLAINLGVGGYNENYMKQYVPAILFTLYDGYYIYAPTKTDKEYEYMLKPYNYYTVRYKKGSNDVVINYTLDNYIVVYGNIGNTYVVKSGYLVLDSKTVNDERVLNKIVPYKQLGQEKVSIGEKNVSAAEYNPNYVNLPTYNKNNDTRTDYLYPRNENYYVNPESAKKYYEEAAVFTDWVKNNLSWVTPSCAMRNNEYLKDLYNSEEYKDMNLADVFNSDTNIFNFNNDNNPEDSNSLFFQHKTNVIKASIQDNLNQAITSYSKDSIVSYEFKLPKLDVNEWDMISSNICMLTFLQGLPVGTRYYNNYALVQSSTNKIYVSSDSLRFIGDDGCYHKIDCPHLTGSNIIGYSNFEFILKKIKISEEKYEEYYNHNNEACYYCIVDSNYEKNTNWKNDSTKAIAYYTALAREKYSNYTVTKYLIDTELK